MQWSTKKVEVEVVGEVEVEDGRYESIMGLRIEGRRDDGKVGR